MTVAILTTGTELVRGELVDRNSAWLSTRLVELGFEVREHRSVGDEDDDFLEAFAALTKKHRFVFVTGGLGPTTDDRTALCVARAVGRPLVRSSSALEKIEAFITSRGFSVGESNRKQADFPEGARVLDNPIGTAPGFSVDHENARCFFFPGVPREMQAIFESAVVPLLPNEGGRIVLRKLRTFGMPESHINDALAAIEKKHDVVLGYRASDSEIEVKVFARATSREEERVAEERARGAVVEIKTILGRAVYGEGETSLGATVLERLRERGEKLALAESCTGGLVSATLTEVPGSSAVFLGGVVAYDNRVKEELLGVPREVLESEGAVSEACARAMASGVRAKFGVDVSVAITGIAGPAGGTPEKPVGLVHFAFVVGGEVSHAERRFFGDRELVRRRAAKYALFGLLERLAGSKR